VVDANILRNDIRRACRTGQRTVLVSAANVGCIRRFCAWHVYDEVIEHSGEWTTTGQLTHNDFLRPWLLVYLPVIRVVPVGDEHQAWLAPGEVARVPASPSTSGTPTTCPPPSSAAPVCTPWPAAPAAIAPPVSWQWNFATWESRRAKLRSGAAGGRSATPPAGPEPLPRHPSRQGGGSRQCASLPGIRRIIMADVAPHAALDR
jgi:hypothetical protein